MLFDFVVSLAGQLTEGIRLNSLPQLMASLAVRARRSFESACTGAFGLQPSNTGNWYSLLAEIPLLAGWLSVIAFWRSTGWRKSANLEACTRGASGRRSCMQRSLS